MYLLPMPHKMKIDEGFFIIKYDTELIIFEGSSCKEFNYAKLIKTDIQKIISFDLPIIKSNKAEKNSIFLQINKDLKEQCYKINANENHVHIIGGDTEGLLYGVQTFRQIINQYGPVIPCFDIEDYPDILERGFLHDVTRGRIPTLKTLKQIADNLSYYKINQMQLYIEHSFLFKDFSEVWRDDTPLSAEEIMEFDEYCQSLNIELVPAIASFGHLHKVLSTKTYSHLCELNWNQNEPFTFVDRMIHHTIDVSNPESFEMIKKMLLEFMPLFSSKKFNICADETFDLGKGKSRKMTEKEGLHRVYVDFVNKICSVVKEQGRQPMFWGDVIIENPELIKDLPEDIICLNWGYSANESEKNSYEISKTGALQYLCPGVHGWRQFLNRNDYAYQNISRMCNYAFKYNAVGILNTDWGDYGHINFARCSVAGMIYGAAFSWNKEQIEYENINKMISVLAYGDKTESFVDIISSIAKRQLFTWENAVQYMEAYVKKMPDEEIKKYFNNIRIENVFEANQKIFSLTERLYGIIISMETSKRELVKEYLIMAKAVAIFNNIGAIIKNSMFNGNEILTSTPKETAVALEYWWNDYKNIWREHSKEGELFRIQDVIFWYADLLRSL